MTSISPNIGAHLVRQNPPLTSALFAEFVPPLAPISQLDVFETDFPAGMEVPTALASSMLNLEVQMNESTTFEPETLLSEEKMATLVLNLVGFECSPEFLLITRPGEEPFRRLQSMTNPQLEFLVVEPHHVHAGYEPDVNPRDAAHLAIERAEDALVMNIVTIHGPGRVTVNLRGPILVNRQTGRGRQVIPDNAPEFSLQHPVQVEP